MPIQVPNYPEFTVDKVMDQIRKDANVNQYFPDEEMGVKLPDRKYVWDILNSVKPEFVKEIVTHAKKKRIEKKAFRTNSGEVTITNKWLTELSSLPIISSKTILRLTVIREKGKNQQTHDKARI